MKHLQEVDAGSRNYPMNIFRGRWSGPKNVPNIGFK
jgi:hypothetical protein